MRRLIAFIFLAGLEVFAQKPAAPPKADPSFSQADMERLIRDLGNVTAINIKVATGILAKPFSDEMAAAAKSPVAGRAAAMQKATDDYQKRVDAFNQGGKAGADASEAMGFIVNPMTPEKGFYQNLLDACLNGHKFLTRTDDGMPAIQQVTTEGGTTILHTSSPGLPVEKTAPSNSSARALCPGLVRNALRATPAALLKASP